ncbi:MAG: hypothetical protein AB7I18_05340 [Candidatus Berkiella sp.]
MYELNHSELLTIHGGTQFNEAQVLGIASGAAAISGMIGYAMSYETFALSEAMLYMSANLLPTAAATGLILGGVYAYHYFRK